MSAPFSFHLEEQREAVLGQKGWLAVSPRQVDVPELGSMILEVFSNLRGSLSLWEVQRSSDSFSCLLLSRGTLPNPPRWYFPAPAQPQCSLDHKIPLGKEK